MHRVLLIDDDAHLRALAVAALDEVGLEVVEASKGRDGLRILREDTKINAIVVDGLLPDTNGIKLIETMRAAGMNHPILFISAFFRDITSFRRLTVQLGVAEVMHKPLDMERFAHAVRGLMPRRRRTSVAIDLADVEAQLEGLERPDAAFDYDPTASGSFGDFALFGNAPLLLGPRVLVLSDDEALVDYVTGAIAPRVAHVEGATSTDGIDDSSAPDIVLLALPFGRPGESSLVLDMLKERAGTRPRVAILAEDSPVARQLSEDIGADLFLTHPIESEDLPNALVYLEALADPELPRVIVWTGPSTDRCANGLDNAPVVVRRVRSWEPLQRALKTWHPHAVIVDATQAGTVRTIRMSEGGEAPAIVVVGPTSTRDVLLAGANNVLKTEEASVDLLCVLATRRRVHLSAKDDALTLMPRRSRAMPTLLARAAEARRTKQPMTFAFIAVDGADSLAERVGEGPATSAVRAFAALLRARFRLEDVRVRWSRDVFALAFPRTDSSEIEPALFRLQDDCKAMRFEGESGTFRLNFCAGMASLGTDGESLWEVAGCAEQRLRTAQSLGRGRIARL